MQTFLPYSSFRESAECLDRQRLGKQRVECKQILNVLLDPENKSRWRNHPAVRMWKGHENCLKFYANTMIKEWIKRGYKNTMELYRLDSLLKAPLWLGDERLHSSHRARLLQKDPDYYCQFDWHEIKTHPDAPYWWPVELVNKKMNEEMNDYWRRFKFV